MDNNLFREKSLKRISSPEQLNDYIKVANPGIWTLIIALIILLIGSFVWSLSFKMDEKISTYVYVKDDSIVALVSEAEASELHDNMNIVIEGKRAVIDKIPQRPVKIDDSFDEYLMHLCGYSTGDWVYLIDITTTSDDDFEEGIHKADIIYNSFTPSSLLFN